VSSTGRTLVGVRHFNVDGTSPLPAVDWLLVSPAGTLNGTAGSPLGHPFGLSLVALGDSPGALTLNVSQGQLSRTGSVSPGDCALSITESGDYRFELATPTGERFERSITVNRDLGPSDGH
jgi:hypothetical protein